MQEYVAYGLILTFGILHGANDLTLIGKLRKTNQRFLPSLLRYIAVVAAVSVVFILSRSLTLLLFVAISAYHFGEQHFGARCTANIAGKVILFFSYGLTILFMIFYFKVNEVIPVINEITQLDIGGTFYMYGLIVVSASFLGSLSYLVIRRQLVVNYVQELFMFLVLGIVFYIASLIWAFAIYFIFWHSLPSLQDQLQFLYGKVTKATFLQYLKSSWLYWMISIAGLAGLYFLLREKVDYFVTVVLYLLAAITFPHVLVMSKVEALRNSPES